MGGGASKKPQARTPTPRPPRRPAVNPNPTSPAPVEPNPPTPGPVEPKPPTPVPASPSPEPPPPPPEAPPPPTTKPFEHFLSFPTPALLKEAQYRYAAEEHELVERDGEVVPCPPSWSKFCYRNNRDFTQVDSAARQVPMDMALRPISELAEHLTQNLTADIDKVRSIYVWVACQRAEKYSMESDLENNSALYKLLLVRAGRYGYNRLFMELCKCVNIRCILVPGAVKGSTYHHGEELKTTNNWCLVLIDGFWGFIDQHWGSTYVTGGTKKEWQVDVTDIDGYEGEQDEQQQHFGMDEDYFLPPPYQFIYDHFPDKSEYELLPRTVASEEFRRMARLRNTYFRHSIVDLSQPECYLSTDTGNIKLGFVLGEDSFLKFNFVLYKSYGLVTHPEGEVNLQNYVYILNEGDRRTVYIEFEYIGTYQLELQVTDVKNNPFIRYVLGSYLIKCTRPQFNFDPPIVDATNPELGPGADWKLLQIMAEEQGGILEVKNGKIHLNLLHDNNDGMEYNFELVGNESRESLRRAALYQKDSDGAKLYVRLPKHGKYLLKVHTKKGGLKAFRNTCNYMVKSDERCVESPFFPDPHYRSRIGQLRKIHDLEPVSHPHAIISVGNAQESLDITMKKLMDVDVSVQFNLNTDEDNEDINVSEYVLMHESDDDVSFDVKIPQHGMYDLTIFTRPRSSPADPSKSWHYVLDATMPSPHCLPFPRRHEAWSSRFLLHSPLHGILEEHTEVDVDIEMADVVRVYAIQDSGASRTLLRESSPGRFSGSVRAVSSSPLRIMAVVGGGRGGRGDGEHEDEGNHDDQEDDGGQGKGTEDNDEEEDSTENPTGDEMMLLEYKIASSQNYAALQAKAREFVQKAENRRKELLKAKKKEEEDAKQREKDAQKKARQEEKEFERNQEKLMEEEERLAKAEKEKLLEERRKLKELERRRNKKTDDDIVRQQREDVTEEQQRETEKESRAEELHGKLQQALEEEDVEQIKYLVKAFADENLKDQHGILKMAKKKLVVLEYKEALSQAIATRDPAEIWNALDRIANAGYASELKGAVKQAQEIADKLQRLKNKRFKKLAMSNKDLQMLRCLNKPPVILHPLVRAVMLILGENEERTESWDLCRKFLKPELRTKMLRVRALDIHPEIAARVIAILQESQHNVILNVDQQSVETAALHAWVKDCVDILESVLDALDGTYEPASVERQKELLGQVDIKRTPRQWAKLSWTKQTPNTKNSSK